MPLFKLTVKVVEPPTQLVADAGVMLQLGLGTHVCVAVQGGLTQPSASVTFAVSVQVPGDEQEWLRDTEPFCVVTVTVSLIQPLSTTV